jgi:general L-amino acid transport system permease protein
LKTSNPPPRAAWSWRSRAGRGLIYQAIALILIGLGVWFLAHNTQENMRIRGIQSGFDFLGSPAGFDIGETLVNYDPSESYGKAIWIGVLNTLRVAVIGIVLTTVLGGLLGVGR